MRCVESRLPRAVLTGFIICRNFGNARNTKARLNIYIVLLGAITSILNEIATRHLQIPMPSASVSYPGLCNASELPVPPMPSQNATSQSLPKLTGLMARKSLSTTSNTDRNNDDHHAVQPC